MHIVFLGCGYLSSNLAERLRDRHDTEIWGIDSPYVRRQKKFSLVDVMDTEKLAAMNIRDAVIIDAMGLVANNQTAEDEDGALAELKKRYTAMLQVLKEGGARAIVFFSSGGTVYGNTDEPAVETEPLKPTGLYARSKVMGEEWVRNSGIPYLILRISNPYGGYQIAQKRQGVIPILIRSALLHQTFEQWVSASSTRDYIYMDDFASALDLLLTKGIINETVNIGSGQPVPLSELIRLTEEETGQDIEIIYQADDARIDSICLNISKLASLTGFCPQVPLTDGIRAEVMRIREEENL